MVLHIIYFFSVYRAWWNHKIAAPVCFISLSAPSITMYAMTIMAQPSPQREAMLEASPELETRFDEMHREIYLPVQHCMMVLSLLGLISALHCLYTRWPEFQKKEFSPAHVAFIFPLLSHTNAVQAYRSGVDAFSNIPVKSPFKVTLFTYWLSCLIIGTILNFIFTYKYIVRLPKWTTNVDIVFWETEGQPPSSPCHTIVHEMLTKENGGAAVHECCFNQTFTNPAVLQANEAGALVRVRRGTEDYANYGPYARTRHVASHGFDLTLTEAEFRRERAELLDWVAKNAPRTRNRTMSIPQCFKLGSSGCEDATTSSSSSSTRSAYGTFPTQDQQPPAETKEEDPQGVQHKRSSTWGGWV